MKKEKVIIKDVWNCFSPYFKGKKEDIEVMIKNEGTISELIINKSEKNGIVSFKYNGGNVDWVYIDSLINKYPSIIVACVLDGDPDYNGISVAVVISEYGYPYLTDGQIVGCDATHDEVTMNGFKDLFEDYSFKDTWVDPRSGIEMDLSVDYSFPFHNEWDDSVFLRNKPIVKVEDVVYDDIHYEDFKIENGILKEYKGIDKDVVIPADVTIIGSNAFKSSLWLKNVILQNGVKEIKSSSFSYCGSLRKITIPNSVTKIGSRAFYECGIKKISIPESVTDIGTEAFCMSSLEKVTIPESVTKIGKGAFASCRKLIQVIVMGNIKELKDNTFDSCYNIEEIVLPNSLTKIGKSVFEKCNNLKRITLPTSIKSIGFGVFWGCSNLEEIVVPEGVKKIEDRTFGNCYILRKVTIPNSVTDIDENAFVSSPNVSICCKKGSFAEEYAKNKGMNCILI